MGDFLSLRVSAVFEDVWYLNSGLFISAVDEESRPLRTPGESWRGGSFWLFGFPLSPHVQHWTFVTSWECGLPTSNGRYNTTWLGQTCLVSLKAWWKQDTTLITRTKRTVHETDTELALKTNNIILIAFFWILE